ncbi:hypothetical protein MAR_026732 [Mya arenaria]|uniref:Uncharacterized protein n=1 Tax=Mya arenaria TaxID=6604 RepID=A0ABY7EUD3_MYAAR|nr:hypothetical protein MAR_026732 [Mya arenaria]
MNNTQVVLQETNTGRGKGEGMGSSFILAYQQQYGALLERSQALERYMERLLQEYLIAFTVRDVATLLDRLYRGS